MDFEILYSLINTKLRDNYSSLDDLCYDEEINKDDLIKIFNEHDCRYNELNNRFEYGKN